MGRFQIGPTSTLITFGNVRLGTWLPNPRYVDEGTALRAGTRRKAVRDDHFPKPRLSYLVKEFLGVHDPSDPYVYVTDGGHWENTGLVELLRPRETGENMPRDVIAIDADPGSPGPVHAALPGDRPGCSRVRGRASTSTSTRCGRSRRSRAARRTPVARWRSAS